MTDSEVHAAPPRGDRLRRVAIGLGVAYALYAVVLGLVAPWLAREPVEELVADLLGVDARIERIRVNPFTLRVELAGVELRERDGALLVSADALAANLELWRSLLGVVRVAEIRLEAPEVHAVLSPEGELNLLALMPEASDETDPPSEAAPDDGLFPVRIDEIRLVDGAVRVRDLSQRHLFVASIAPIHLVVERMSTVPGEEGRVLFEATGSRGVHLTTEFEASVEPLAARGELRVEDIGHSMIGAYLGPEFVVRPTSGTIDLEVDFAIESSAEAGLVVRVERGGVDARDWQVDSDLAEVSRVGLDRFSIEGLRLSLSEREVVVERIALDGPHIAAVLPAAGEQAPAASAEPSAEPAEPAAAEAGTPPAPDWKIGVERFEITRGGISIAAADARDDAVASVGPIDVVATGLSSVAGEALELTLAVGLPAEGGPVDLAARTSSEGPRLEVTGSVVPRPLAADVEVKLVDAALAPFSPLIGFAPGTRLTDGRLDVTSKVQARLDEATRALTASAQSDVDLRGLAIDQPRGSRGQPAPVIRIGRLRARGLRVEDSGARIRLAQVRVESPRLHVERNERGELNLARLMAPGPAESPDAQAEAAPGAAVDVRRVELVDGRLDYRDATPRRRFELDLADMKGTLERSSAADGATQGSIDFGATVGGTAPLTISGRFPSEDRVDFHVLLDGLSVTTLAPYFEQYVGSEVEQGKLDLDLDYEITGHEIYGRNQLRFDRLVFGRRTGSKDALRLPVPLAFKLLTDRNGQTVLDLPPIRGNLDDPDFDLRTILVTAFVKVIQQALSSPLAVLQTAMPDLTADKRTQITFALGSAELDPAQREKLMNVAAFVASDDDHRVSVKGRVDARRDRRALRKAGEDVDEERLRDLGNARARAVQNELVDRLGLDPERLFLRSVDLAGKAEDDLVAVDVVLTDD